MARIEPVLRSFEDGKISRPEMLRQSRGWQANEHELRGQVSELYAQAREKGCL